MDDEPTLPSLPPRSGAVLLGRKRPWGLHAAAPPPSFSASSDPAVFSSDDDPALDNYENQGRHKKRYVGTWFSQHPASSDSAMGEETQLVYQKPQRGGKRQLRRQLDSGVWMGQDGLTDSDESMLEMPPAASRLVLSAPKARKVEPPNVLSEAERHAQVVIQQCLDEGREVVDLDGMGLTHISDRVLETIARIEPYPVVEKDVEFVHRDPKIHISMANNLLSTFPAALLNLEHLTVLSLRHNRLTEVPRGISKLKNLVELNISYNRLRWLPNEILELMAPGRPGLRALRLASNPFWKASDDAPMADARCSSSSQSSVSHDGLNAYSVCRTPVEFRDGSLRVYSRFQLPGLADSAAEEAWPTVLELEAGMVARPQEMASGTPSGACRLKNPKGARSLMEMALKVCARADPGELESIISSIRDYFPGHLSELIAHVQALQMDRMGRDTCAICKRELLIPFARWVEFYRFAEKINDHGSARGVQLYPVMRGGCSWRCIPAE